MGLWPPPTRGGEQTEYWNSPSLPNLVSLKKISLLMWTKRCQARVCKSAPIQFRTSIWFEKLSQLSLTKSVWFHLENWTEWLYWANVITISKLLWKAFFVHAQNCSNNSTWFSDKWFWLFSLIFQVHLTRASHSLSLGNVKFYSPAEFQFLCETHLQGKILYISQHNTTIRSRFMIGLERKLQQSVRSTI